MMLRLIATASLLVTLCCLSPVTMNGFAYAEELPVGHQRLTVKKDGRNRECLLYVPTKCNKSKSVPIVIMFHGMGGTALNTVKETGWSTKAEKEVFLVAYPEATRPDPESRPSLSKNPQSWNDGSGRFFAAEQKIDDVGFVAKLIDQISEDYSIDPDRIYVAGFSNGASMAFRIGAELSRRVAAIAPAAGACWTDQLKLEKGVSLCYMTGDQDSINPLDGGFPRLAFGGKDQGGQKKPPVQKTIDKWVKALGCPESANFDMTQQGVRTRRYGPGRESSEVEFIVVEGLGHHWAGGNTQAPEFLVGKNNTKLNATERVWDFFLSHPKQKKP